MNELEKVVKEYVKAEDNIDNHKCGSSWCLKQDVECEEGIELLRKRDELFEQMKRLI